jgi:uncharacterized membrane protein
MKVQISEAAVFRWVVIVGMAAASIIALALLTRPLYGAIWALILVLVASWHGYRWVVRRWRQGDSGA